METNKTGKEEKQRVVKNFLSEARKAIISEACFVLHLQGKTSKDIIQYVKDDFSHNLDRRTLEGWVKKRINQSKEGLDTEKDIRTALELEKINNLERQYWHAWEESKKVVRTIKRRYSPLAKDEAPKRQKRTGPKVPAGFKVAEEVHESREQKGDVKFLLGVQWCIEQRTLLLGHTGAAKVETVRDKDKEKEKPIVPGQRVVKFITATMPQNPPTEPEVNAR